MKYKPGTADFTWRYSEQTAKDAMLTICSHAVNRDISKDDVLEIMIVAGLIEEVE